MNTGSFDRIFIKRALGMFANIGPIKVVRLSSVG
jgi:hypothetical protein